MNRRTITRAASLGAALLVLTACGGTSAPEVASGELTASPTASAPAGDASTEPTTDETTGAASETDEPAPAEPTEEPAGGASAPADPAPASDFSVEPEGQELALVGSDGVEVLYTLPDEGESVFRAAAVQPGSTRDDMTVVVVTSAEGMYDLRWLEVRGGEVGELELFPEAYRIPSHVTADQLVPVPVWSPDGRSVAWVHPAEDSDAAVLQTIGWDDGPGTGDTADDNASFALDTIGSAYAQARDWTRADDGSMVLRLETDAGRAFDAVLERQADGALALLEVTPAG